MLKRTFDPKLIYRVVVYLRMSTEMQNERSPQQQLREIRRQLKSLGYSWVIVKVYRDDAKSGRILRKREGYQKMMRELKSGIVAADMILVDDIERFSQHVGAISDWGLDADVYDNGPGAAVRIRGAQQVSSVYREPEKETA